MTQVVYAPRARQDVLRLADFLSGENEKWAEETARLLVGAVQILEAHPLIGRPAPDGNTRELVIARGRSGYLALYKYDPSTDVVVVLAVRHQREAGFEE